MPKGALKFKNMSIAKQQAELGRLRVLGGPDHGTTFVLTSNRVTIGRGEENDVILSDLKASRKHAEVMLGPGIATVRDMGSSHGIAVNGAPTRQANLRSGDKIGLGETVLEVMLPDSGATRLLQVVPDKTASEVGTGTSGLTQFIPRLGAAGSGSTVFAAAGKASFFDRNKTFILTVAVLLAVAALLPEVEQKQRAKRNKYLEPKEVEAERSLLPPPSFSMDEGVVKSADIQFKEGFREYRAKNYLRALAAFETALQIYGDHPLARIYLESTKKEMADEAKEHFKAAKRDEEAHRLEGARMHYEAVKRLFAKDQVNDLYKEAELRASELEKRMKEALKQ